MNPTQLSALLVELLSLPTETEWVEWKHNNDHPDMIAERISALANSAALHWRDFGYLVWGVEDGSKNVVGTTFRPGQSKKGNEELENWLMRPAGWHCQRRPDFSVKTDCGCHWRSLGAASAEASVDTMNCVPPAIGRRNTGEPNPSPVAPGGQTNSCLIHFFAEVASQPNSSPSMFYTSRGHE